MTKAEMEQYIIKFNEDKGVDMRKDLKEMRYELMEIAENEATKLYRLAWRMTAHGCKAENIAKVREEANKLHMTGYPERLLDPFVTWEYAFRF